MTALERLVTQAERLLLQPPSGGCNNTDAFRLGQHRELLAMLAEAVREDLQARAELAALTRDQLATVLAALDDAAEAREARGCDNFCADCADSPDRLCESHAADLDACGAYRVLRAQLGGAS